MGDENLKIPFAARELHPKVVVSQLSIMFARVFARAIPILRTRTAAVGGIITASLTGVTWAPTMSSISCDSIAADVPGERSERGTSKTALIIGAGPGISLAFAKKLVEAGYTVALASRNLDKLRPLAESIGADEPFVVDCEEAHSIVQLFEAFDARYGGVPPAVVLYNGAGGFHSSGEVGTIAYSAAAGTLQISALGAFVAGQEAGKRMLAAHNGAIFFTGATAGVKAFKFDSVFAMGKFALRGLAQGLYKELSPQGIHVCHFVIDGGVRPYPGEAVAPPDSFTAEAIATSYMLALQQPKGAWSWEVELRSKDEEF